MFLSNKVPFVIRCLKTVADILKFGGLVYFAFGKVTACDDNKQQQNHAFPPGIEYEPAPWAPPPHPGYTMY